MNMLLIKEMLKYKYLQIAMCCAVFFLTQGCTSVSTFPTIARAGDTVSVMIGGTENARKDTVMVTLIDANGQEWDMQALGLVRSVFNLRTDGRAEGAHYSTYLESYIPWYFGHEPVQTVLVVDLPIDVPAGNGYFTINTLVDDNSSGVGPAITVNVEILTGLGASDDFYRQDSTGVEFAVDFARLEPSPHAKIEFGTNNGITIGAVTLIIDFDESILDGDDINVYVPESNVRGSFVSKGAFGDKQRMVYWRQDGQQLFIDVIAPQGIDQTYLMMYILHPRGLSGAPNLSLVSSKIYDVNGDEIYLIPSLSYYQ